MIVYKLLRDSVLLAVRVRQGREGVTGMMPASREHRLGTAITRDNLTGAGSNAPISGILKWK